MANAKTRPQKGTTVADYLSRAKSPPLRRDAEAVIRLMRAATGAPPVLWGNSFIGLGSHEYPGSRGRTTIWPVLGLAIRGEVLSLYLMSGIAANQARIAELGPCKTGKGCLYLRGLDGIRLPVLRHILQDTVRQITRPKRAANERE